MQRYANKAGRPCVVGCVYLDEGIYKRGHDEREKERNGASKGREGGKGGSKYRLAGGREDKIGPVCPY